jgi:hypothetical protein
MANQPKADGGTVSGAYGRDYRTSDAAAADFLAGKDFVVHAPLEWAGAYCSIRDFRSGSIVNVRFKARTQVVPVTVP